jgi:TPP-dependent 2-oxoacid decarboxylase
VNRWLITGLVVIVILIIVGVAYDQGVFENMSGSTIGMILAGIAAPYMAIKNWLFGDSYRKQFRQKYAQMNADEQVHRVEYDQKIAEKEKRVAELDKEIRMLDTKLELLELKKKNVEQDVKSMSIEQTKSEVKNLFGD